jgi:hypothetical protein
MLLLGQMESIQVQAAKLVKRQSTGMQLLRGNFLQTTTADEIRWRCDAKLTECLYEIQFRGCGVEQRRPWYVFPLFHV